MELPSAADIGPLPSPPPGMALSVYPPAREHLWDPFWWDMGGRDIIDQRHIFDRYSGMEQIEKLREVLEEFPWKGGQILDKAIEKGEVGIVEVLLQVLGVEINENGMVLNRNNVRPVGFDADSNGETDEEGDDADADNEADSDAGEEEEIWVLHNACFQGQTASVKILVEKGNVGVNAVDDLDSTPLLNAARAGDHECVEFLLEHGADPTWERENDLSIFQCAAASGNIEVLRMLAQNEKSIAAGLGIDLSLLEIDGECWKPEMIKFILQQSGIFVEIAEDSRTYEILTSEQRAVLEQSLYRAVSSNSIECLELLLTCIAPRSADGKFEYYEIKGKEDRARVFNATEPTIENTQLFELTWETLLCPPPAIREADAEAKQLHDDWLNRRLMSSVPKAGALDTAKLLLERYGANVNHISHKYHMTPLFAAAAQGQVDSVRYLLEERGADINLGSGTYANGPTALHQAIRNRQTAVMRVLLEHGGPIKSLETLSGLTESVGGDDKVYITAVDSSRAPVYVYSQKQHDEAPWTSENSTSVTLDWEDVEGIEGLIGNLQTRRRDARLREDGENARPLMEEEKLVNGEEVNGGGPPAKNVKMEEWLVRTGLAPRPEGE